MTKNRKRLAFLAAAILLIPILALLLFPAPAATFVLRDGTQLEILQVSYGTKHVAHVGNLPQKLVFKITGPRLSYQWVGPSFVIGAQDSVNGNLGLFARHRLPPGNPQAHSFQNLDIQPTTLPHKDHATFISSGAGEYSLWELNYWNENHTNFIIKDGDESYRILRRDP